MIRPNSIRDIGVSVVNCNWVQIMENSLDPVHLEWLHFDFSNYILERLDSPQDVVVHKHKKITFDVFEHGIIKRRMYKDEDETSPNWTRGHPILFPNTLAVGTRDSLNFQFRVPMDDTHTLHLFYQVYTPGVAYVSQESVPVFNIPVPVPDEDGQPPWNLLDNFPGQDIFAWITQGPIAARDKERLGHSDEGVILFRTLLKQMIQKVQQGQEPMNVFRDPAKADSIEITTERDVTKFPGGPAAKYSPVRQQVEELWAQAHGPRA
jgi:5,5'-dehydrodivanillate O-demethylase